MKQPVLQIGAMIDNDDVEFLFKVPPYNICSRFEQVNVSIILVCGIILVLKVHLILLSLCVET